jgi:hypothetical protein
LPLANDDDETKDKEKEMKERAVVAGGRCYRLATAGGDSKVRVSIRIASSSLVPCCVGDILIMVALDDPP